MENQNRRIFIFFFIREFSFCGKPELENFFFLFFLSERSRIVGNQNRRIFFFLSENSRLVENRNGRMLVLWKTRIGEFFFVFFFYPRILVLWKTRIGEFFFFYPRILVLGKTRIGEFFFFFLSENSRFVENGKQRILVL